MSELIDTEWLRSIADKMESGPKFAWAVFEVESAESNDGYLSVKVDCDEDNRPDEAKRRFPASYAIEIETGVQHKEGWSVSRVGIGLYTKRDDLLKLLEILARGNHF